MVPLYGQGKIRDVYAPHEIVSGDTFAVAIVANAAKPGIERMAVVSIPSQVKFVRSFMSYGALSEPEPLGNYSSGAALFQAERGRRVIAVNNPAHSFPAAGAFVYYFIFVAPELNGELAIRPALAERGQEIMVAESPAPKTKKGKKPAAKPKQTSAEPLQWQIVSPQTSQFRLGSDNFDEFERSIRCVTGWENTSRALMPGEAQLALAPEHIADFFSGPFTIEWWQQGVTPSVKVFSIADEGGNELLEVAINIYGQIYAARNGSEVSLISNGIVTDGEWHHIVWSHDDHGTERLFVDAALEDTITHEAMPEGISTLTLGSKATGSYLMIDELHLLRRARIDVGVLASEAAIVMRDTAQFAFAIFHFEGSGDIARSSIPLAIASASGKPTLVPITLRLEGKAKLEPASAPVILEHAVLSLEQSSPSKVAFKWKATSESGVVRYELQRRIETFGEFEKVLSVPVHKPVREGEGLIARNAYAASENLPVLKRTVDLYYRLAVIGKNDSVIAVTMPLKFELGKPGDIFLEQNKPNPFNPKTTIGFTLKRAGVIKLSVFDIIGREVLVVVNKKFPAGRHTFEIDATNWPGGIYFYKLKSGNTILTRRMTLAK